MRPSTLRQQESHNDTVNVFIASSSELSSDWYCFIKPNPSTEAIANRSGVIAEENLSTGGQGRKGSQIATSKFQLPNTSALIVQLHSALFTRSLFLIVICFPARAWFIVAKRGNIIANAAGSIDHVHGEGVSFVDYGLEEVAAQKLAG